MQYFENLFDKVFPIFTALLYICGDILFLGFLFTLAEFKLIEIANFNDADAILGFESETKVESGVKNTTITTFVSGYAVKIKPDTGYTIVVSDTTSAE